MDGESVAVVIFLRVGGKADRSLYFTRSDVGACGVLNKPLDYLNSG